MTLGQQVLDAAPRLRQWVTQAERQLRVARLRNDPAPALPTNFPPSMTTLPREMTVSVTPVTSRPSYGL